MFLHIEDNMTIGDVQERFSECFPQLTIAFYSIPHRSFALSDERYRLPATKKIGSVRRRHNKGALEIKSWYSVAKVERELRDLYDLHAQILRQGANGETVQTTLSDSLTLGEQSQLALRSI
jgi:hypothetical protein